MTADPVEAPEFVAGAGALLVNLGTLDPMRREAVLASLAVAELQRIAWVLDPVFVDRAPHRLAFATKLLGLHPPAAIRANAAEIAALFGSGAAGPASPAAEGEAARAGAAQAAAADAMPRTGSTPAIGRSATSPAVPGTVPTVIATGEVDAIAAGGRTIALGNGHPLMAKVTATGCAVSAMVAACLAVESDAFVAAVAAVGAFGVAAEVAGTAAKGPGTFAAHLLDALHALPPDEIAGRLTFR
jgi:hydroxyethylthiazole kinase